MKRTKKDIYDFVKKKIDEAKAELAKIGDGYRYSNNLDTKCCVLEAKIKAYHEVLNFIGTIRTKGGKNENQTQTA